jgi:hypothetical protein
VSCGLLPPPRLHPPVPLTRSPVPRPFRRDSRCHVVADPLLCCMGAASIGLGPVLHGPLHLGHNLWDPGHKALYGCRAPGGFCRDSRCHVVADHSCVAREPLRLGLGLCCTGPCTSGIFWDRLLTPTPPYPWIPANPTCRKRRWTSIMSATICGSRLRFSPLPVPRQQLTGESSFARAWAVSDSSQWA